MTARVDRCVCFDVTFARVKADLDRHGGGLDRIREQFGCGKGCALCVPYLERMLETGETVFEVMTQDPEGGV